MEKNYYVEYLVDNQLVQTRCDLLTIKDLTDKKIEIKRYIWR